MTPADAKDWWLAAAALTSTLTAVPSAQADTAPPAEKAGVVSGLKPDVRTAKGDRVLYVGSDMYRGEKLVTGPEGSLHILFMDQSSITLGPNSELTIDEFVYDPNAKKGKIGVSLAAGLARVVGGQISKTNETTVKTASGTIGIRGGISVVETGGQSTSAVFLFGSQMRTTDNSGNSTTTTRPGFGTSLSSNGISSLTPATTSEIIGSALRGGNSTSIIGVGQAQNNDNGGSLVSTGGSSPGGNNPTTSLANDRLGNVLNTNTTRTEQNILGSGQNDLRTVLTSNQQTTS